MYLDCSLLDSFQQSRVCQHVVGWSEALMDDLARRYLNDHGCLDLHNLSTQTLGGPVMRNDSGEFIWLQATIWFLGGRNPAWSSVQQCGFRMIVCMPTRSNAGTLITNFVGKAALAEEISRICTENVVAKPHHGKSGLGLRLDISLFRPAVYC
jgi:hypothetical protein